MSGDFTFMKGNIDIIILCALSDTDKYGYEIAKEIKEKTSNRYEIKQPTLYSYLKRLEDDGLIVSYWGETSNGGRRRYYKLTQQGREDCESFVAEWQYQRTIMSDLVDETASGKEISQKDATPLFGRKVTSKRSRKGSVKEALDEQDEISRRLKELIGEDDTPQAGNTAADTIDTADYTDATQTSIFDIEEQPQEEQREETAAAVTENSAETAESDIAEISEPKPAPEPVQTLSEEQRKLRFDVQQDNAEDFIQGFEALASEASRANTGENAAEGENYQHILLGMLSEQLEGVQDMDDTAASASYYTNHPAALEDVADDLAKEGVRIRIYNHATAVYKPKQLMPQSKVLFQSSLCAFVFSLVYFGILALCSIANGNWLAPVIAVSVMLLVPIGFLIYSIVDTTRKDKPNFRFKKVLLAAVILSLIVILLAVGISTLNKIEYSNFADVTNKILLPTGIVLYAPMFVVAYNYFYKKY